MNWRRLLALAAFSMAAPACSADDLSRADLEQAAIQFEIANFAAQSDNARDRFVAGLLLMNLPDDLKTSEIEVRRKKLFADAEQSANDDAMILAWRLAVSKDDTERLAIAQRLTEVSPDWVMGWLASLPRTYSEDDLAVAESILAKAAAAPDYNGKSGELMRHVSRLAVSAGISSPMAALREEWLHEGHRLPSNIDAAGIGLIVAMFEFSLNSAHQFFYLDKLKAWCSRPLSDVVPPSCDRTLQRLSVEATELQPVVVSQVALHRRATNDEERIKVCTATRELEWVIDSYSHRIHTDFDDLLDVWKVHGTTALGAYKALMSRWGIPLTPPSDYSSRWTKSWDSCR